MQLTFCEIKLIIQSPEKNKTINLELSYFMFQAFNYTAL